MKYVFTIINMFLIATIAYFCVDIIYKNVLPANFIPAGKYSLGTSSKNTGPRQAEVNPGKNQYDSIVKRNIFKADIEKKESSDNQEAENKAPEKLEVTTLKLVLWGTVTGEGQVYAVIEDKKVRQQALYEVGDSVQGAKVIKILRHEVILNHEGKDQVLEMETDNKNVSTNKMSLPEVSASVPPVNTAVTDNFSNDINILMKQIKMRPHFSEGEPDGLMVYGIRPNSVFRQIGLRNGDIIKDINGTAIISAEDISNLYSEIIDAEDVKATIFRRGKIQELSFQDRNRQDSIPDFPEKNGKNKGEQ